MGGWRQRLSRNWQLVPHVDCAVARGTASEQWRMSKPSVLLVSLLPDRERCWLLMTRPRPAD